MSEQTGVIEDNHRYDPQSIEGIPLQNVAPLLIEGLDEFSTQESMGGNAGFTKEGYAQAAVNAIYGHDEEGNPQFILTNYSERVGKKRMLGLNLSWTKTKKR